MNNAFLRIFKILLICSFFLATLVSCIDLSSDISIGADGSGTIQLSYTASMTTVNLGTIDEKDRFYAVPVSRKDFQTTVDRIDGLTLRSFDLTEDADTVHVEATLGFDSVDALSQLFSSSGPGAVEISANGSSTSYRQIIYGGSGEDINEESRQFIETFFIDDSVEFTLEAPRDIIETNIGEFDGRKATAKLKLTEILLSTQPVIWEVQW